MTPERPQALAAAIRAGAPDAGELAPRLARMLSQYRVSQWNARFAEDVVLCLERAEVDGQVLARTAAALLLAREPGLPDRAAVARVGADPLWRAFLSRCINLDPGMEARLAALSDTLADALAEAVEGEGGLSPDLAAAACALALQAEAGEWVAGPSPRVEAAAAGAGGPSAVLLRAIGARPGLITPGDRAGIEAMGAGLGAELMHRLIDDPAAERAVADALPRLTPGGDRPVSAAVRDQYEASPYPRWRGAPDGPRRSFAEVVAGVTGRAAGPVRDLLIAGCGTGYEAADLARMDPSLRITAVDLSGASLGYAARRASELGLGAIDFVQGDLLDLAALDRTFDAAVSTGVLHHMAEPEAGLGAIAGVLRPGGVVRVALYSRRARAAVRAAHAEIARLGLTAAPDDIRAFRRDVLDQGASGPLADLVTSDDFYSLSGARDLMFHVHERHYDPLEVGALLASAGLELVAVEAPPEGLAAMQARGADPLDLAAWDAVEADQPGQFAGMIAVWGRRAG